MNKYMWSVQRIKVTKNKCGFCLQSTIETLVGSLISFFSIGMLVSIYKRALIEKLQQCLILSYVESNVMYCNSKKQTVFLRCT
jgi:hypothetical protein